MPARGRATPHATLCWATQLDTGGVSDGTTLWFVTLAPPRHGVCVQCGTRARDATRDIVLGQQQLGRRRIGRHNLWFVTDTNPDTAFAYNAARGRATPHATLCLGNSDWHGRRIGRHNPVVCYTDQPRTRRLRTMRLAQVAQGNHDHTDGTTYTTDGDMLTASYNRRRSPALLITRSFRAQSPSILSGLGNRIRGSLPANLGTE